MIVVCTLQAHFTKTLCTL